VIRRRRVAAGILHRLILSTSSIISWVAPAPLGARLLLQPAAERDRFYRSTACSRQRQLVMASLKQLILPALTLGIFSLRRSPA